MSIQKWLISNLKTRWVNNSTKNLQKSDANSNSNFDLGKTSQKASLTLISFTLPNRNKNDVFKKWTISRKEQTQEPPRRYIPLHLEKVDKI